MMALLRGLCWGVALLVVVAAAMWFWPAPKLSLDFGGDADFAADPVAAFAAREAAVEGITPGAEARVVWAGEAGAKTDWAVLYVHGFSATSEEIRPVPDLVAAGLEANLVYLRLTGHGRPGHEGAAMAEAEAADWARDFGEGLAAARAVAEHVLVMGTSTGGTLAAAAAAQGAQMDAVVFVSPNFALANPAARMLTMPGVRLWGPKVAGEMREFSPSNSDHAMWWTHRYPTVSVIPMAELVADVARADLSAATMPALFIYSEQDQVVRPKATAEVLARWGGPVTAEVTTSGAGGDPLNHVLAGAALSPAMSEPTAELILTWMAALR